MFKKNGSFLENEIIVATSKSEKKTIKLKRREEKVIKDIKIIDNPIRETNEYEVGNFTFYDSDPQNECSVKDSDIEEVKSIEKNRTNNKDISSYFEESKKYNSMMQEKDNKEDKESKKQTKIESECANTNIEYVYEFRNIKYTEVEGFIEYLNRHYQDIENISKEALSDEKLYDWISKKSNVFDDSLKQFKDIKEKIENK